MSGEEKMENTAFVRIDADILHYYKPTDDCKNVTAKNFVHPPVTKEEQQFPIAFGFAIYKETRLLERILQAINMPNNVYCVHIDTKSSEVFRRAIQTMIRCLPNVYLCKKL